MKRLKKTFTHKSMISNRSSCEISYLVRAKLYPINRIAPCYKSGNKRWEVCKYTNILPKKTIILPALSLGKS